MSATLVLTRLDELASYWAARQPGACATTQGGKRQSYLEMDARVRQLANALRAAGVGRGDRVAVLQTPHPEFLITLLATASLGAIWVGLNPKYRQPELVAVVRDCQPKVMIARSRALGRPYSQEIEAIRVACSLLEHVVIFDGDPPLPRTQFLADFVAAHPMDENALRQAQGAVRPEDPCLLVYTSGSTGAPKGALLSHLGILTFARLQNNVWPVKPAVTLNYFPINHVGSIVDISVPCLYAGGTIVFLESFDAAASLRLVHEQQVTFLGSVPSAYQMQMASPAFVDAHWRSVQLLVWEGAAMPAEAIQTLLAVGCPMATNYNMTEANAITVLEPTRDFDLLASTVGSAYPGVSVRLLTESGIEAGAHEPGEVWVKSPCNCLGYWNQPQATADAFSADGFFRTGDIATRRADGRYRLIGRVREMFKSGGYNVYPREVERVIEEHPAVAAAVLVPKPDPLWQEVGVAVVVPKPGMTVEFLEQWLSERLVNYKRPKSYLIRESLPLLPIGKVDRAALKRLVLAELTEETQRR